MRRGEGRGAGTPDYGTTLFSRPSTSQPAFACGSAKLIISVSRRERCAGRKECTLRFKRESKKIIKGSAPGSAFCPLLCSCPRARSASPPVVHLSSIQRNRPGSLSASYSVQHTYFELPTTAHPPAELPYRQILNSRSILTRSPLRPLRLFPLLPRQQRIRARSFLFLPQPAHLTFSHGSPRPGWRSVQLDRAFARLRTLPP